MDDIKTYLRADEKLLWSGRPQQGLRFYAGDVVAVPFSLIWAGFVVAIFTAGGAEGLANAPFPFMLFPLIFGAAGLYCTVGRFIHDAWIRSRIAYALTDRRVLVLRRVFSDDLTALDLNRIDAIKLKGGRDGARGDIVFGQEPAFFAFGQRSYRAAFAPWTPSLSETPAFLGVEDARQLFDKIEELRANGQG